MTATAGRATAVDRSRSDVRAGGRRRRPVAIGRIGLYVALIAIAVVYLYPFLINIATSFKTDAEATDDPLSLIPQTWSSAAYSTVFGGSAFPRWFANSAIVTVAVTLGRTLLDSAAGYALARLRFPGSGLVFAGVIGVMAVPGVVLLIPKFLVINQLGMYDSYSGLILPIIADAAGVFIMKNFFESIPVAVEEAARVDGAGTLRIFWSVVLPMARPALITIVILSFQGSWNELSHYIVAAQSPDLYTLTRGVASLTTGQLGGGNQYPVRLAAAVLMTIPVAVLFVVFQRRLTTTATGAVKERAGCGSTADALRRPSGARWRRSRSGGG